MKRLLAIAGLTGALALAGSAFAGSAGATTPAPVKMNTAPVTLFTAPWPGSYHWFWD